MKLGSFFYLVIAVCVAMIGYQIHGDLSWSVLDFIFWPIALIKWLVCHQINLSVVKATFSFLLK